MEINFGEDNTAWAQHGYAEPKIVFNGEPTGFKAIVHNDTLVKVLTDRYHLFPNEEALKVGDKAADLAGLQPFGATTPGMRNVNHVVYDAKEHKMRALYTMQGDHKVGGDTVNVGVNVYNSIDGTTSFGAGLFTFRSLCSNGVIFGKHDIRAVRHAHTKGLIPIIEELKGTIVLLMEEGLALVEAYQRMAQTKLNDKLIDKLLASYIPAKVLPDYVKMDDAKIADLTQWDLYNDITEAIWHNPKTGLKSKVFQFQTLHQAMPLLRV
jgi:hypothetical protein